MNGGHQKTIERCQQYQRYECGKCGGQNVENLFVEIIFAQIRLIGINVVDLRRQSILFNSVFQYSMHVVPTN